MSENTPTPAAATPAVLPLSADEIADLRLFIENHRSFLSGVTRITTLRLLATLDAATARADAAEKLHASAQQHIQITERYLGQEIAQRDAALAQERQAREQAEAKLEQVMNDLLYLGNKLTAGE